MLVNGQFIKEPPPKIGAHYAQDIYQRNVSPEEQFIQDIMLGINPYNTTIFAKFFERLLRI